MAVEPIPEPTRASDEPMPAGSVTFDAGRQILLIGAALAALVVVTVVAVLLVGSRTATFPEGSAERALQDYLVAFEEEDYETAYAFFSAHVQQDLSPERYEEAVEYYGSGFSPTMERRVRIERVSETDEGVRLHLVVEEFYDGGLGSSGYSFERDVRMVREDGEWKIDEPLAGLTQDSIIEFEELPPHPAPP